PARCPYPHRCTTRPAGDRPAVAPPRGPRHIPPDRGGREGRRPHLAHARNRPPRADPAGAVVAGDETDPRSETGREGHAAAGAAEAGGRGPARRTVRTGL